MSKNAYPCKLESYIFNRGCYCYLVPPERVWEHAKHCRAYVPDPLTSDSMG